MNTYPLPTQKNERILLIDAIRGIALCGILILNINFFARPYQAMSNLKVFNETSRADVLSWYATNFALEGSFRALFSILFGAGVILLLSRLEKKDSSLVPADIYYRRLIWLLIFGLINAYVLLWVGDILYAYALCGLFLFPLRKASVRLLLGLTIFFIAVVMFKGWLSVNEPVTMREKGLAAVKLEEEKKELTDEQKGDLEAWNGYVEKSKIENIRKEAEKEITVMRKSYAEIWLHLKIWNQKIESTKFYNFLFFDVMIFMLLGMALFKLSILTGEKPLWLYAVFLVFGYSLGIGSGFLEGKAWRQAGMDFFEYLKIRPFPVELYQLHRVCVAMGHIGLIVLMWKSGFFSRLLKPFASVGQMAFTNYLMQSVICTLIFFGYGLGFFGRFQRYELWFFVAGVSALQIIFSVIWLRFFRFGPLEWLWRTLTYWKVQPLVREKEGDVTLKPFHDATHLQQ